MSFVPRRTVGFRSAGANAHTANKAFLPQARAPHRRASRGEMEVCAVCNIYRGRSEMFYTIAPLRFAVQNNVLGLTNGREQRGTFGKGRVHVTVRRPIHSPSAGNVNAEGGFLLLEWHGRYGAFCFESRVHFDKQ